VEHPEPVGAHRFFEDEDRDEYEDDLLTADR
jgi:hypothetical protein